MDLTFAISSVKDMREKLENFSLEGIKWNDLKRVPQTFKRKVKIGNYTCDEEFDMLHKDLGVAEAQLKQVIRASKSIAEESFKHIELSLAIAKSANVLLDPYNNFSQKARDELKSKSLDALLDTLFKTTEEVQQFSLEFESCKKTADYIDVLQQTRDCTSGLAAFANTVEEVCLACLKLIDNIKHRIKMRNVALDEYDSVNSKLTELDRISSVRSLTSKESQLQFNLERKLDFCKNQYSSINRLFLEQLPLFLDYVKDLLEDIFYLMFYLLLSTNYQIVNKLEKLQDVFQFDLGSICKYSWNQEHIQLSNHIINEAIDKINELNILDFTTSFYKSTLDLSEPVVKPNQPYKVFNNLYKALYHYKSEQDGDLSFNTGDIIKVHKAEGDWWEGEVNGQIGLFPFNYVEDTKNHLLNSS